MARGAVLPTVRAAISRLLPSSPGGRAALVVFLILGTFLRVAALDWGVPPRGNAPSFYHDEGHVLAMVEADWDTYRRTFGEYEVVRPVFFWRLLGRPLLALGTRLGWNDPGTRVFEFTALRSLTAAFGIAALIGIYLLGRAVGRPATGLWALAFLALMPGHWYYSQILKGDVIVATIFIFLLLVATAVVERGTRGAYLALGVLFGAGTALKPTVLVAAPVLLLAHILRVSRERSLQALVGSRALGAVIATLLAFLALYPYPFLDASRLSRLLTAPTSQHFALQTDVTPAVYRRTWAQYNAPTRPLMEMIFGLPLQAVFVPSAAAALLVGLWAAWTRRSWALLFTVLLAALFFHSLTFTDPLDDRYVVPLAPAVALFPAVVASVAVPVALRTRLPRVLGAALGAVLLAGTALTTAALYPSFGLSDPREEATTWVTNAVPPGGLVGQPTILSRWSLVFDRRKVEVTPLIVGADAERRVARWARPDVIVVQREPWNYDHTFRYDLEGVRAPFASLLAHYERRRTFGREPQLWGYLLPRNIGVPVIDVYERRSGSSPETTQPLRAAPALTVPVHGTQLHLFPGTFTPDDLRRAFVRVRFDLRAVTPRLKDDPRLRLGLVALWDGSVDLPLDELPGESTLVTKPRAWAWLTSAPASELPARGDLTIVLDQSQNGLWDVYEGFGHRLQPKTMGRRTFQSVRFGVIVLGPEAASVGSVRVTEAVIGRPR